MYKLPKLICRLYYNPPGARVRDVVIVGKCLLWGHGDEDDEPDVRIETAATWVVSGYILPHNYHHYDPPIMSFIRSARIICRYLPNHQRTLFSDLSQGHAALDRGTAKHQHPQDENAKYVKSGLDANNRRGVGKRASREGTVGNKEG